MAQSASKATDTKKKSTTAKTVDKPPKAPSAKKTTKAAAKTGSNGAAKPVAKTAGEGKTSANAKKVETNAKAPPAKAADKGRKRGTRNRGGKQLREKSTREPLRSRTFPIVRETIRLDHAIPQGAYDRHFDSFRSAFFHCTSVLGRCGIPKGADQVNNYILDLIDNARIEMENETARIAKLIKEETGSDKVPRSAPDIQQRTAEVPSFLVRKYLTLFPAADRLVDAIVYAEIAGVLSWQRRAELLNLVKKYLRSPWGRFHSIAQKLMVRHQHHHKNMAEARKEIQKVLDATLVQHKSLQRVEQKRPMQQKKTGTEG
jgi:hypothetical protein